MTVVLFLIFCTLVVYEVRALLLERNFDLTDAEKVTLQEQESFIVHSRARIRNLRAEGSHLKKNLDGSYHRGSKLGMRINDVLDELVPEVRSTCFITRVARKLPLQRIENYISILSWRFTFRLMFVLALIACIWATSENTNFPLLIYIGGLVLIPLTYFARQASLEEKEKSNLTNFKKFAEQACDPDFFEPFDYGNGFDDDEQPHQTADKQDEVKAETPPWHQVLGVAPSATRQEIDAAWRKKMTQNHPDKVAELDDAFQQLAKERAQLLNWAKDEGLRVRTS